MLRIIGALAALLLALSLAVTAAAGEFPGRWREVFVTTQSHALTPEGIEGRSFGVLAQRGIAFYPDGTVASLEAWLTYERDWGETIYRGLVRYAFPDGSTQLASFEGFGNDHGRQKGTVIFLSGTGRFEGIRGEGHFTAENVSSHGDLFIEVEADLHLPEH